MIYESYRDNDDLVVGFENIHGNYCQHFHQCIEFNYVIHGEGLQVDIFNTTEMLRSGEIVLISSMIPHGMQTIGDTTAGNLLLPAKFFSNVLNRHPFPNYLIFRDQAFNKDLIALIRRIQNLDQGSYPQLLQAYIDVLLLTIVKEYPAQDCHHPSIPNFCFDVVHYIADNFQKDLTLGEVARHMGYNTSYFSRLFNQTFHCNFKTYLNRIRLTYVHTHKGCEPKKTLAALVSEAGFNDISTYHRAVRANGTNAKSDQNPNVY